MKSGVSQRANRPPIAQGRTKLLLFRRFVTLNPLHRLIHHFRLPTLVGLRNEDSVRPPATDRHTDEFLTASTGLTEHKSPHHQMSQQTPVTLEGGQYLS